MPEITPRSDDDLRLIHDFLVAVQQWKAAPTDDFRCGFVAGRLTGLLRQASRQEQRALSQEDHPAWLATLSMLQGATQLPETSALHSVWHILTECCCRYAVWKPWVKDESTAYLWAVLLLKELQRVSWANCLKNPCREALDTWVPVVPDTAHLPDALPATYHAAVRLFGSAWAALYAEDCETADLPTLAATIMTVRPTFTFGKPTVASTADCVLPCNLAIHAQS